LEFITFRILPVNNFATGGKKKTKLENRVDYIPPFFTAQRAWFSVHWMLNLILLKDKHTVIVLKHFIT
jgi:hypothetical protein